jgi:exosome complex RNA-binding protein Rrp42 (RNase PH superfamily)
VIRAGPAVITASLKVAQSSIRHKNKVENKRLAITNKSKIRIVFVFRGDAFQTDKSSRALRPFTQH